MTKINQSKRKKKKKATDLLTSCYFSSLQGVTIWVFLFCNRLCKYFINVCEKICSCCFCHDHSIVTTGLSQSVTMDGLHVSFSSLISVGEVWLLVTLLLCFVSLTVLHCLLSMNCPSPFRKMWLFLSPFFS